MENEYYRAALARIEEKCPGKELLNKKEVAMITGRDHRTIDRHYPFTDGRIYITKLAQILSK